MCSSEQDANQLWAMVQASVAINLPLSVEERLQVISEQARSIIGGWSECHCSWFGERGTQYD